MAGGVSVRPLRRARIERTADLPVVSDPPFAGALGDVGTDYRVDQGFRVGVRRAWCRRPCTRRSHPPGLCPLVDQDLPEQRAEFGVILGQKGRQAANPMPSSIAAIACLIRTATAHMLLADWAAPGRRAVTARQPTCLAGRDTEFGKSSSSRCPSGPSQLRQSRNVVRRCAADAVSISAMPSSTARRSAINIPLSTRRRNKTGQIHATLNVAHYATRIVVWSVALQKWRP